MMGLIGFGIDIEEINNNKDNSLKMLIFNTYLLQLF